MHIALILDYAIVIQTQQYEHTPEPFWLMYLDLLSPETRA